MESQVQQLSSYLCVSCGKIATDNDTKVVALQEGKGLQVKGLSSIAKYLARKSNVKDILGRSGEDCAVVDQWLEYRVSHVDRITHEKDQHAMLKEVNTFLSDKVYLTGFYYTLADLVLYLGLHPIFSEMTFHDKQQYLHLSRWFDQVQHLPSVQKFTKKIHFQKNLIYSKYASH